MTSISQLANNLQNTIESFSSAGALHPESAEVKPFLSTITPANWMTLSFPYTFSVVNIVGTGPTLGGNPFADFSLPIAPNAITQDEKPAIHIQPTQGGTTTSHSGNRYKILSIKGTTGINPFRGAGGVNRKTGVAVLQPNDLKHKSGYEVFLTLRNWFRAYYEYKKQHASEAKDLRLVFKNYKDGEFLIVELQNFRMERQASRSFLYDYTIELRVLAHFTFKPIARSGLEQFSDALDTANVYLDAARGTFLKFQDTLRQIESTYDSVILSPLRRTSLALKALAGVPFTMADVSNRSMKNTIKEATVLAILLQIKDMQDGYEITGQLDPRLQDIVLAKDLVKDSINRKVEALIALKEGALALDAGVLPENTLSELYAESSDALANPRSFYENTITDIRRVQQNYEDYLNLSSATYDGYFDRTSTVTAAANKVPTLDEYELLYAFTQAQLAINLMLTSEDLFKASFDQRIAEINDLFAGSIDLQNSTAVRQYRVPAATSLERIAQQELGDSTRWGEIAILNELQHPYIVDDATTTLNGVATIGQVILLPSVPTVGFSRILTAKETTANTGLSTLELSFGTDIRLDANYDIALTPTGDFDLVSGIENLAQQIRLKLSYEKGELMRAPEIGAGIQIGTKIPNLTDLKDGVSNTLLQDPRIDQVTDLLIKRESSSLFLTMNIKIKNVDIPIPIRIPI